METQSSYRIEHLRTLAQLDALEKDWTDLIGAIPEAPIFLTWEWVRTWWAHFGQDRELWLLTARDQEGQLLGLAPLMRELVGPRWMGIRGLSYIGTGMIAPAHLGILARTCHQERLEQAFLVFLLNQAGNWDVASFASVAQDAPMHSLLMTAGGRIQVWPRLPVPYIPLPGDWETYCQTLNKKLRRNLRYFRSKLENDYPGKVDFRLMTEPRDVQKTMERLTELCRARWHARKLSTAFDDSGYLSFHQAIADTALSLGWLRLHALTADDRVIAVFYCFHFHDRIYAYQIGFDLDWSGYSPGRLLIAHGIQAATKEGSTELDWGPGDDEYKLAWTEHARLEDEIFLHASWRGKLWVEWQMLQGFVRMKAKQWLPEPMHLRIKQFAAGLAHAAP